MVAPVRIIASDAAVFALRHCSIGLPRCPATTVKYSDAPVGYTCEMWHSTNAGVPVSASAVVSASVTAAFSAEMLDQLVAVSRVSHKRAGRQQRVAQVRRVEAAVLPCARRRLAKRRAAMGGQQRPGLGVPALDVRLGSLEHRDREAAAGDAVLADALGGGQVDAGLGFVGEPDDGRARYRFG